jgi:hypothetical protein
MVPIFLQPPVVRGITCMIRILVLIFVATFCARAFDNPLLERGLDARLIVVPAADPSERPHFAVWLELTNTGIQGNLGLIPNRFRLSLMPQDLHLRVVDADGHELTKSMRTEDQMRGAWEVEIPPGGKLDFPIGNGGGKPYEFSTGGPGQLLTFGLGIEWIIPRDGKKYFLCGTLHEDRPERWRDPRKNNLREWIGSVDIPKVQLPQN